VRIIPIETFDSRRAAGRWKFTACVRAVALMPSYECIVHCALFMDY
jgi:hypothetical protein